MAEADRRAIDDAHRQLERGPRLHCHEALLRAEVAGDLAQQGGAALHLSFQRKRLAMERDETDILEQVVHLVVADGHAAANSVAVDERKRAQSLTEHPWVVEPVLTRKA